MTRGNPPAKLSDVLQSLLRDSALGERMAEAAVVPEWPDIVGPQIAGVTRPLRVADHVLLVGVQSSPWLLELRMMERQILRKLNASERRPHLAGIRFLMVDPRAS